MGQSDRKKRRQSMTFPDLASINNVRSESEIHDYYMNKNFLAPEKIQLETIFEAGGRRGASENGELISGKNKAKRYIEDYSFWKQNDKEKNRRRKLKIQKQFKGRKRVKTVPSTIEEETRLIELIQNAPEVDNINDSSRYEQSEVEELLEQAYEIILLRCRRSYLEANAALPAPSRESVPSLSASELRLEQQPQTNSPAKSKAVGSRFETSSLNQNNDVSSNQVLLPEPFDSTKFSTDLSLTDTNCSTDVNDDVFTSQDEQSIGNTIGTDDSRSQYSQQFSLTSESSKKDTNEEFDPSLILQSMKDDAMKEEFLKALEDTDLMFCEDPLPKPKATAKKAERMSMRRSVRRSARFMNHEPDVAGSVDIEVELQIKQARARKKKVFDSLACDYAIEQNRDSPKEIVNLASETSDKVKKKRRMMAQIDLLNDSNKENVPIVARANAKRKPTFRYEMSSSSSSDSEPEKQEQVPILETSTKDHTIEHSNASRRSSTDISLPDCVRRSLTGEFVPLPHILLHEEPSPDKQSEKKHKKKTFSRRPLGSLPIPEISIEPCPSNEIDELEKNKDCTGSDYLQVPDKGIRKDSFDCSDEEVYITGLLKFGDKKKKNDLLNKRITPSISSVDSDFC